MALDVGDRRIGIAVTDALGMTVQGRPTRVRTRLDDDIEHIRELVEENSVAELVVGYPVRMDGSSSRQTAKTENFAKELKSALSIPIVFWDERLTSFTAEQRLEEMGLDWRKRRKHVDEFAATLILEDYLARPTS
jgi:putative Holliday junction resolvase